MDLDISFVASILGWVYVLLLLSTMYTPETKAFNAFKLLFLIVIVGLFVWSHYWFGAAIWMVNLVFPISRLLK